MREWAEAGEGEKSTKGVVLSWTCWWVELLHLGASEELGRTCLEKASQEAKGISPWVSTFPRLVLPPEHKLYCSWAGAECPPRPSQIALRKHIWEPLLAEIWRAQGLRWGIQRPQLELGTNWKVVEFPAIEDPAGKPSSQERELGWDLRKHPKRISHLKSLSFTLLSLFSQKLWN